MVKIAKRGFDDIPVSASPHPSMVFSLDAFMLSEVVFGNRARGGRGGEAHF